jgi:hypothetical protein
MIYFFRSQPSLRFWHHCLKFPGIRHTGVAFDTVFFMTNELNGRNKLDLFGSLALGIATAGALGSLAFTLQAGSHNSSVVLDTLFSGWVLSPFVVLIIFCILSRRMPSKKRVSLYFLIMGISIVSLLFYGRLLSFSEAKPAFIFLVFPLISWIIILPSYAFLR